MGRRRPQAGAETGSGDREKLLLVAIGKQDRRAFAELYRLYQPRLYGFLRRLIASMSLVEEVIDDVMFVVWTDARKFRGQSAVSSWIFGIAYRKALTAIRKDGRYQTGIDRATDTGDIAARAPQDLGFIQAGLDQLSADHRQVVELTYFCGFSYKEIAEIADCPVNTVKTRMFHARRRLKVLLPRLAGEATEKNSDYA